ncbi:thiamine ABC transporter ATP-binding protein [Roseitranquillus sediminis]|uniref:thiamine ABC transporter ATP-binding protein n=1 Tax=Roseitranquillus sediminis TaxID=2809051 RepID=UPI001D0CC380|nr:ATP-binding cassette domain-containing protein [Roseitranquillus sediminis]MBM9593518.1 ATP-binding cassette domain-containing protein [Roseitranquillus sediminis]
MLTFDRVEVRLGDFELVADLGVERGARVAVIGPSGAGKSTLLQAVAGFIDLTSGQIEWRRQRIDGLAPGVRPVSVVFQDQNLFPHLTAFQNVALGVDPRLRLSEVQRANVERALDRVGLGGLGERKPAHLSGGQQGRVGLARVLLRRQPILLLDEPFSALGPALKVEMLDLVSEVATETGATVLMVTHDPDDARRFAPQTVLVANGVAHPPQNTTDLLRNPPAALRTYLG